MSQKSPPRAEKNARLVIVLLDDAAELGRDRWENEGPLPITGVDLSALQAIVDGYRGRTRLAYPRLLRRIRGLYPKLGRGSWTRRGPRLERVLEVLLPRDAEVALAEQLALELRQLRGTVTRAWVPPALFGAQALLPPLGSLGDTEAHQGYLEPALRHGVDAHLAWKLDGGAGHGVRVCLVDQSYLEGHEDLPAIEPGPAAAYASHGTMMLGILGALIDDKGYTGICHAAEFFLSTTWDCDAVESIRHACDVGSGTEEDGSTLLGAGDVMVLPLQNASLTGYCVEMDGFDPSTGTALLTEDVIEAIETGIDLGITVVESAGNSDYTVPEGLSRAVIVGAGAPASDARPHRRVMGGFGPRVDCQGWGEGVATTSEPVPPDHAYYTRSFEGTSSAAGIVAGVAACLQGAVRRATASPGLPRGTPLSPDHIRDLLQELGTPQDPEELELASDPEAVRIGPLPDLEALMESEIPARIYLRDSLTDDGNAIVFGPVAFDSPDILIFDSEPAHPELLLQYSSLSSGSVGDRYTLGSTNYLYVRAQNVGGRAEAGNVLLLDVGDSFDNLPGSWTMLGRVELASLPAGEFALSTVLPFEIEDLAAGVGPLNLLAIVDHPTRPFNLTEIALIASNYLDYRKEHRRVRGRSFTIV